MYFFYNFKNIYTVLSPVKITSPSSFLFARQHITGMVGNWDWNWEDEGENERKEALDNE
jgi:hypothetical protein